jgi:hypothetical protein
MEEIIEAALPLRDLLLGAGELAAEGLALTPGMV